MHEMEVVFIWKIETFIVLSKCNILHFDARYCVIYICMYIYTKLIGNYTDSDGHGHNWNILSRANKFSI